MLITRNRIALNFIVCPLSPLMVVLLLPKTFLLLGCSLFRQRLINMQDYDKKLYENVEDLIV